MNRKNKQTNICLLNLTDVKIVLVNVAGANFLNVHVIFRVSALPI